MWTDDHRVGICCGQNTAKTSTTALFDHVFHVSWPYNNHSLIWPKTNANRWQGDEIRRYDWGWLKWCDVRVATGSDESIPHSKYSVAVDSSPLCCLSPLRSAGSIVIWTLISLTYLWSEGGKDSPRETKTDRGMTGQWSISMDGVHRPQRLAVINTFKTKHANTPLNVMTHFHAHMSKVNSQS